MTNVRETKKSSSGYYPGPRFELNSVSIQVLRINAELACPSKALRDVLYWWYRYASHLVCLDVPGTRGRGGTGGGAGGEGGGAGGEGGCVGGVTAGGGVVVLPATMK